MNKQIVTVVIATRSVPLADGLQSLLEAIPLIEKVEVARTIEHAILRVEAINPRILVVDLAMSGRESKVFLEKIVLLSPETLRVLLVDDVQDLSLEPQYAEATFLNGVSPSAVATLLTNLLSLKGDG
jgi:DNA-binding NarL/FixJ family response regulator